MILHLQQKEQIQLYYFPEAYQKILFQLFSIEVKLLQYKMQQYYIYFFTTIKPIYQNTEIFSIASYFSS